LGWGEYSAPTPSLTPQPNPVRLGRDRAISGKGDLTDLPFFIGLIASVKASHVTGITARLFSMEVAMTCNKCGKPIVIRTIGGRKTPIHI
jgi:hypothetical protein